MEKVRIHKQYSKEERAKFANCGSWVDEVYQLNPFLAVKDTGGSNGCEDVEFKRMLRSDRFCVDLPDSVDIPVDHRSVLVVERIFLENYENIFITWTVKMADGSVQNPYKYIGLHETSYNKRRDPSEEDIVRLEEVQVKQSAIDGFRDKATIILSKAQRRALLPKKKKTAPTFEEPLPEPEELSLDGH